MAKLRAVVLAAGRGMRMGGMHPKTLIPLGDRKPLLHYILAGLKGAGVTDLFVVTGHGHNDVQDFVGEHAADLEVTFARNPRFASWGNFHSVRVALDQSPGFDLLVVNSDIVVNPEVYERVLRAEGDLVLAVERKIRLDEEDMRVRLDGTRVRGLGKDLKMNLSHGEYDGVSLIRGGGGPRGGAPAARVYLDIATELEWRGETSVYYEDVYARMLDLVEVRAAFVESGEYAEVDVPEDVAGALEVIERFSDAWGVPASTA